MAYIKDNITIVKGDYVPITYTFNQNGTPVSISSWDFFLTVKENETDLDADALIVVEPNECSKSGSPTVNTVVIPIIPTKSDISAGTYYFDVQVVNCSQVNTIQKGRFIVEQDITERTA